MAEAIKEFTRKAADREEGATEPTIEVSRVDGKAGTPGLVVARFQSGGSCADFVGLTFIWAVSGSAGRPKLTLINDPTAFGVFTPEAAFDLDGDGRFELFGDTGGIGLGEINLIRPANGYGDRDSLGVTSLDCYC